MSFISQNPLKLIKKLTLLVVFLALLITSAQANTAYIKKLRQGTMEAAKGKTIKLHIAINDDEQLQGLSDVLPEELNDDEGMLFFNKTDELRRFWMPNTYINLDIFFLDANLKVLKVFRDMKAHPGFDEFLIPIARTGSVKCRHVLELKSSSPFSKEIKEGMTLKWTSTFSLPEIGRGTHRKQ